MKDKAKAIKYAANLMTAMVGLAEISPDPMDNKTGAAMFDSLVNLLRYTASSDEEAVEIITAASEEANKFMSQFGIKLAVVDLLSLSKTADACIAKAKEGA